MESQGALTADRFAEALTHQAERLAAIVAGADLATPVPTCPGWDLRALLEHLGQAHRWGTAAVRRRMRPPDNPVDRAAAPADPRSADWLVRGAAELVDAVREAGATEPVWNFLGSDQHAGFWLRRMAHETAVHGADAALALGVHPELEPGLSADAISEWLTLLCSPALAARRPDMIEALRGDGQTLHLHATDSPSLGEAGEWLIHREPDGPRWTHGHQKGNVAVRGPAADLLLAVLGRLPADEPRLRVFGDTKLFEHWVRSATF
jgi:uncharacterized protein (TIGR03083 family)